MIKTHSLTQAVVGAKWLQPGLISNADGTLSKAFMCVPLEAGNFEADLNGPITDSFFAKLADLLTRLPNSFEGHALFQRRRVGANALESCLFFFERVKTEKAYSHLGGLIRELGMAEVDLTFANWASLLSELLGSKGTANLPDLIWEKAAVVQGNQEIRAISLTELPQVTWMGCFQELFDKAEEFSFSLRFNVPHREKTRKQLETKRRINHALSIASSLELQNIESNSVLGSSEETLERILVGKESLLEVSAAIIVTGVPDAVQAVSRELVGVGSGIGNAGLYQEGLGVLPVLKSHIPGNKPLKIRTLPILSGNLAHLMPILLDYSRVHDTSPLNLRARSGERSNLNLFSKANLNFNGIICGASGSGKSFLMNSMISSLLEEEPRSKLCIFDVGGSYRKLVAEKNGISKVLTPAEASSLLATFLKMGKATSDGLYRSLVEVLCGVGVHITHSHRVAIGELLQDFTGLELKVGDFIAAAKGRKEAYFQDLAHWLKPFAHLDGLSLDHDLLNLARVKVAAFDFKELSNDPVLERTTVLILSALIWEELKEGKSPKTLVVFDEVWRFFKGVRDFIEEMYRTFRKYSAGIVSISQNAADYGDDEFARMIFSNSFTKIFLEGGASRNLLTSGMDLSNSDIARAMAVASRKPIYSEFFVSSGQMSQIMRLYPSSEFYKIANTENITH
jgi:hypothetical protein